VVKEALRLFACWVRVASENSRDFGNPILEATPRSRLTGRIEHDKMTITESTSRSFPKHSFYGFL
jgi:hypothetical protein